jgi:hypothetical protein
VNQVIGKIAAVLPDPLKWIDDAIAILHYGFGYKVEWYKGGGWNGATVERLLNRYGIRTYWRDYGHGKDRLGVHVPKQQAKWADYVLRRAGAPLAGPALSNTNPGTMPAEWGVPARSVGFAGLVLDILDPLRGHKGKR